MFRASHEARLLERSIARLWTKRQAASTRTQSKPSAATRRNRLVRNLARAGLHNPIQRFEDGQQILDFLFRRGKGAKRELHAPYLLLLDIRMPKVDGVEVLRQIKADTDLRKLPVIMLTTTDDPREVVRCHELGCSHYIVKPVDYEKFSETIKQVGLFFSLVQVPPIDGNSTPSKAALPATGQPPVPRGGEGHCLMVVPAPEWLARCARSSCNRRMERRVFL